MVKINLKSFIYPINILQKIRDNFVKELKNASKGKKTSLIFIKNPLPPSSFVLEKEIFQVMVVGGSVFEKAIVVKQDNKITLVSYHKDKLPIFKTAQEFFLFFERHLENKVKIVSLNFAYSLNPTLRENRLDGKLNQTGKGQSFKGLINKTVGQEIEKYIFKTRKRKIKIAVANDTICLLLSGLSSFEKNSIVAGVVGTGTNFALFLDKSTVVNLESGNFDKFPQTETGKKIDKNSNNPGKQLFEKEVSGAYLYQHYNLLIKKSHLNNDPHIDKQLIRKIDSTLQLNNIAKNPNHPYSFLAKKLFERSASFIACQIAGIYQFKKSKIKNLKLKIIMEGSLFWQAYYYQNYVKKYLRLLGVPLNAIRLLKIKNSQILGAAKLVV